VLVGAAQDPYVGEISTSTPWSAVSAGIAHALFTLWVWYSGQCERGDTHLPIRFLGVQYLDIFGPMINELQMTMGKAAKIDAVDAFERTREDVKRFMGKAAGCFSTKHVAKIDDGWCHRKDARERLTAALVERTGSLRQRHQLFLTAIRIAEAAGLDKDDEQLAMARRSCEKVSLMQELTRFRRVLRRWQAPSAQTMLKAAEVRNLTKMCEDIDLRVSQLQEQVSGSRSIGKHAHSDSEGLSPRHISYAVGSRRNQSDGCDYSADECVQSDDGSKDRFHVKSSMSRDSFRKVENRCEDLLARADHLIFDASHTLKDASPVLLGRQCKAEKITKGVRFESSKLSKRSSQSSLSHGSRSSLSGASAQSNTTHLAALVKHATEPLHKADAKSHFENTLAMTMPVKLYNTMMAVLFFVWVAGVVVHSARILDVRVAWDIRPVQDQGRSLSEASWGSFLARVDKRREFAEAPVKVMWPRPFFRPRNLHHTSDAQLIASNGFSVFKIASTASDAEQITCPIPRHDALVAVQCDHNEMCNAIVAKEGELFECKDARLGMPSPSPLLSIAGIPTPQISQAWVASDYNITRVFAAAQQGVLVEFARQGKQLVPVAEFRPPSQVPANAEWQALSLQEGHLLAIASRHVHVWDLASGRYVGSWVLPASRSYKQHVWCSSSSLGRNRGTFEIHGLTETVNGLEHGAELRVAQIRF